MSFEFAAAVEMDLERHIIRHENYKGRKRRLAQQCLRLPFDGWTLPALLVTDARWNSMTQHNYACAHEFYSGRGSVSSADTIL